MKNPLTIKDGFIFVPEDPGLGVELDEKKVEEYKRKEVKGALSR